MAINWYYGAIPQLWQEKDNLCLRRWIIIQLIASRWGWRCRSKRSFRGGKPTIIHPSTKRPLSAALTTEWLLSWNPQLKKMCLEGLSALKYDLKLRRAYSKQRVKADGNKNDAHNLPQIAMKIAKNTVPPLSNRCVTSKHKRDKESWLKFQQHQFCQKTHMLGDVLPQITSRWVHLAVC